MKLVSKPPHVFKTESETTLFLFPASRLPPRAYCGDVYTSCGMASLSSVRLLLGDIAHAQVHLQEIECVVSATEMMAAGECAEPTDDEFDVIAAFGRQSPR